MKKIKRQPITWEKIFINQISINTLILNIYKELNNQKKIKQLNFKNGQRILVDIFKRTYRWLTGT